MQKLSSVLLGIAFLTLPFVASSQENPQIPEGTPPPSVRQAPPTAGNIACFDYYHFGSVQADLQPSLSQTVPGMTLSFSGEIVNDNEYPLVDGTLYVKIFKRDEGTFSEGDGNPVVDQFVIEDDIVLSAKGSKEASFNWKVPLNAEGGDYYAGYFFATSDRYNLMGLSFTDDIVGNQAPFTVTNPETGKIAKLNKQATTLNNRNHHFAAFPLHFGTDEIVTVKTTITNPSDQIKTLPLQWNQYAWDALNETNRRNTKTELVTLAPNETKEVSYEVIPQRDSVVYITAIAQDGESKSFLNIRYVRDGVDETRINFPGLSKFPLQKDEPNRLFSCAHATTKGLVEGNTLILTLKDKDNEVIYQYRYEGDITGEMGGFGEEFLPQQDYDYVTLTAELYRDGSEVENVSVVYDCKDIDPASCGENSATTKESFASKNGKILVLGIIAVLLLGGIFYRLRKRPKTVTFIFAFIFLSSFLNVAQVEAKSVTTNASITSSEDTENDPYWGTITWMRNVIGFNTNNPDTGYYYARAKDINMSVTYSANVTNTGTGAALADNQQISVGTCFNVTPTPYADSDIQWFGTPIREVDNGFTWDPGCCGTVFDSPNGHWVNNANAPALACLNQDSVGEVASGVNAYMPLSVNPPARSVDFTGSTATVTPQANGSYCVTSPGTVKSNVTYPATSGKFYHRRGDTNTAACTGDSLPMGTGDAWKSGFLANNITNATPYTLSVPAKTITHTFSAVASNNLPNAPTIGGPTTGAPNVSNTFTFQATDPDSDTLRYGVDWDNNSTVDQWIPASGYVASNTQQSGPYTWTTEGTKTFQALTQDSKGASSGWTTYTVTIATAAAPTPTASLTVNSSEGPLSVARDSSLALVWSSANATTCTAYGAGWGSATPVALTGTTTISATQTDTYILSCTNGTTTATDSVQVTLTNSLKVCQNSCSSGIQRGNTSSTQSFTLAQGGSQNLVACFNTAASCTDNNGDVTGSTTWQENTPGGGAVSLSGTAPKTITGIQGGSELISATYSGQTSAMNVTVTCLPTVSCDNAPGRENYCQDQSFTTDNGCGVSINCNGTKTCNYNWKEVAP